MKNGKKTEQNGFRFVLLLPRIEIMNASIYEQARGETMKVKIPSR